MKKNHSISFQLGTADLQNKRFLTLYKRLQKNRALTRFCREAFFEKVDRQLNGLDPSYVELNKCIKENGIEYVLEAINEKGAGVSNTDEIVIQEAADKIIEALKKELQKESSRPALIHAMEIPKSSKNKMLVAAPKKTIVMMDGYKNGSQNKPDIEKLKALLS